MDTNKQLADILGKFIAEQQAIVAAWKGKTGDGEDTARSAIEMLEPAINLEFLLTAVIENDDYQRKLQ